MPTVPLPAGRTAVSPIGPASVWRTAALPTSQEIAVRTYVSRIPPGLAWKTRAPRTAAALVTRMCASQTHQRGVRRMNVVRILLARASRIRVPGMPPAPATRMPAWRIPPGGVLKTRVCDSSSACKDDTCLSDKTGRVSAIFTSDASGACTIADNSPPTNRARAPSGTAAVRTVPKPAERMSASPILPVRAAWTPVPRTRGRLRHGTHVRQTCRHVRGRKDIRRPEGKITLRPCENSTRHHARLTGISTHSTGIKFRCAASDGRQGGLYWATWASPVIFTPSRSGPP